MKMKQILLLFAIFLLSFSNIINGQHDFPVTIFNEIAPQIRLTSTEELSELLNNNDMTYVLFYYKSSSKNSRIAAGILKQIADHLVFLAEIILIDCESEYGLTSNPCTGNLPTDTTQDPFPRIYVERPPSFKFNPYTGEKQKYSEFQFRGTEVSTTSLHNFITENITDSKVTQLNEDNIESFLE